MKTYQPKPLTNQQMRALHLGCKLIAESLNDAGKDMRIVLRPEIDIPWTTQSVKDHIFRPIMRLMTSKESTTELSKQGEIDEIWETAMRFLLEHKHLDEFIEFPVDKERHLNELTSRTR